ncbi:ABC transporter ATP-binding protein [Pseudomonas sp.]|uniref:ABC transporter ATP-binding protein n=1 Tax=Pseudomonas sp. TaxID=306 RepID=UPI0019F00685|nr:ABC transporter ATP-binding protein [Pseudomonas sp.]MBF0674664.1 ABC transporter ATP-binding protein [Pseudomonas sp.]
MTKPVLAVESLTVTYSGRAAVADVGFSVESGSILGVVGPNGAGKSSLVKAVTGKLSPAEGAIFILGERVKPGQAYRHPIGYAPQMPGLYSHLTCAENLTVFARWAGIPKAQVPAAVATGLEEIDLCDRHNTLASQLSGGMRQRLHVAVALLAQPKLIVLDEPTSGVDLAARAKIHEVVRGRARQGSAVMMVSHELSEVAALCDRVAIFAEGRLVALDSPDTLIRKYVGGSKLFTVQVSPSVPVDITEQLHVLGWRPVEHSGRWTAYTDENPSAFLKQLDQCAGEHVQEVNIARPGLADVMRELLADESAS